MNKKRDLPNLDLLKGFEAAARHLSFTKAGVELFLTQSAISRQVQMLEEQLGVQLFQRRTRALLLTDAGQLYFHAVRETLQRLREATARLVTEPTSGMLTVAATVSFASLWLVPRLSDFQRQYPEITVLLVADNAIQDLKRDQLDVAIRYTTRPQAGNGAVKLMGERVMPVCSPKLFSRLSFKYPEDLANSVLLHYEDMEGQVPWLSWKAWFEVMQISPLTGVGALRFSHYDQLIQAAIDGQGVALGRVPLVEEQIRAGKLVVPFKSHRFKAPAADRAYWVIVSPLANGRSEVTKFVNWLRERTAAPSSQTEPITAKSAKLTPRHR